LTIVNPIYLAGLATGANGRCYRVSHIDTRLNKCKTGGNKESKRSKKNKTGEGKTLVKIEVEKRR